MALPVAGYWLRSSAVTGGHSSTGGKYKSNAEDSIEISVVVKEETIADKDSDDTLVLEDTIKEETVVD